MPEGSPVVLILGMHRSGTSLMAGLCHLLGANVGKKLIAAKPENAMGFWEPDEIVRIHDDLLDQLGYTWDDMRPLPDHWWQYEVIRPQRQSLLEIFKRDFSVNDLACLKDPRLCRMLPLWQDIFNELQRDIRYLFQIRNPSEVAASLGERNGFPAQKSYLLTLRHWLEAENATRQCSRAFVNYADIIQDWQSAMRPAWEKIGLPWPNSDRSLYASAERFVHPELRHHTLEFPAEKGILCSLAHAAFGTLQEIANDRRPSTALDEIGEQFDRYAIDFEGILTSSSKNQIELHSRLKASAEDIQRLSAERDHQAGVAVARVEEIRRLRKDLRSDGAIWERRLQSERANFETRLKSERLNSERQLKAERERWEKKLYKQQELVRLQGDVQRLNNQIQQFYKSTSWRITKPLRIPVHAWHMVRDAAVKRLTNHSHSSKAADTTGTDQVEITEARDQHHSGAPIPEVKETAADEKIDPPGDNRSSMLELRLENGVVVLATKHTLFVALLIKRALNSFGFNDIKIRTSEPDIFDDKLHIVVCPQMFQRMPPRYISFQMEQSVSDRWFDEEYLSKLKRSMAVMDYSLDNIQFLQSTGLSYRQLFWTPLSNILSFEMLLGCDLHRDDPALPVEYDVAFYGDVNNPRRKEFLDEIGKRFKLLIVSETFGEELYRQLKRAKLVVNIHYYEDALLETTRIFECLSLGMDVVSEESVDMQAHVNLERYITFTPLDDIEAMLTAIESQLSKSEHETKSPEVDINNFTFYFGRVLVALDLLSVDALRAISTVSAGVLENRVALSLPETRERYERFRIAHSEVPVFNGLRHMQGWIGCALSYRHLCQVAQRLDISSIEVCEDDAEFGYNNASQWETIKRFLFEELSLDDWDIFCGLIADVADSATVLDVIEYEEKTFVFLDKMTSMVCNIYGKKAISIIAQWDPSNRDVEFNTIDRYLEHTANLITVTTLPFSVGHRPELVSTLWSTQNDVYDEMIGKSQVILRRKVDEFLRVRDLNGAKEVNA